MDNLNQLFSRELNFADILKTNDMYVVCAGA